MYKVIIRNFGLKSVFNRERTLSFKTGEEVIDAVEKLRSCNYYILDENENVITVEDLIKMKETEWGEESEIFIKDIGKSKIKIYAIEKDNDLDITIKIENKSELYRICMDDDEVFVRLEVFKYYKDLLCGLKDIDSIKEIINLIFN